MSGLTSRDRVQTDQAFTGEQDLLRAWAEGVTPDADLTVSEWADKYRMLASRASAEPGRYRTETAVAVLWGPADATLVDATVVAVLRGPAIVNGKDVVFTGTPTAAQIATAQTALAAVGILTR